MKKSIPCSFLALIIISSIGSIYAQELWSYDPSKDIPKYDSSNREWGVYSIAMSDDSSYIAVGLYRENMILDTKGNPLKDDQGNFLLDKQSKIVMLDNKGKELWEFKTQYEIENIRMSGKGEYIVVDTASYNCFNDFEGCGSKVYVFNKSGTPLWAYDGARNPYVDSFGNVLIATPNDIAMYNIEKKLIRRYSNDRNYFWASDNLDLIAIVSSEYDEEEMELISPKLGLFDKNGKKLWERETGSEVNEVDFSNDRNLIVAGTFSELYFFDKKGNSLKYLPKVIEAYSMTPDGKYAIVAEGSYYLNNKSIVPITLLNERAEVLWNAKIESIYVSDIYITNDGEYIYLFQGQGDLIILDGRTGEIKTKIENMKLYRTSFSKEGEYLAAGGYKLYLFDTKNLISYSNTKNVGPSPILYISLLSITSVILYYARKKS
ncbi:MAG TPA: hypothetical protein PKH80_06500 [Methanofastidiosum sp.]|nr:hypothetical protein [Methanofastidiosum sp.]HNU62122.1 hypothetical protein [Methanofastidiosum sp.]